MKRRRIVTAAAVLLAAGYWICCAMVKSGYILPRTAINGIKVGGMAAEEAEDVLAHAAEERVSSTGMDVLFAGGHYKIQLQEALELDYAPALEEISKMSQGAFWTRGFFLLKAVLFGNNRSVPVRIANPDALHEAIAESGLLQAGTVEQTSCKKSGGRLLFKMGKTGEAADEAALGSEMAAAVLEGRNTVVCPAVTVAPAAVDIEQVYREIHVRPSDASLDPENGYRITASVTGVDFDQEAAYRALEAAGEGSTVTVDLVRTEPEITTEDLKAHLFRDRLASYTTQVGGTAGRRENIRLAAEKCNGAILLNGDVFSYNETVGEQTAETGFHLANATENGKLVQAYGGGICQVSSTIFAAALYADLKIEERWEHEYVPRYIDAGIDAAVAWDALDLKLCNDKKYPVRLNVAYQDGMLEVTIWGTKTDDSFVEVETETMGHKRGRLLVQTYRKVYNGDKSQMFLEKAAYSEYID